MASPFAEVANARILWDRPTELPEDFREGWSGGTTDRVVVELFLKASQPSALDVASPEGRRSLVAGADRSVSAWVTRWAVLPDGADWLAAGTGWTWTETGLLPAGLGPGRLALPLYWGPLPPSTVGHTCTLNIDQAGGDYGTGGIGAEIRAEAGDQIIGSLQFSK